MINNNVKTHFKKASIISLIVIFMFVISLIIFKYEIEGEDKEGLPFYIEKISVVSTADGIKNTGQSEYLWSGELIQVNDIYIKITKTQTREKLLQNVIIQNIEMIPPIKGDINSSRITKNEDSSNRYVKENLYELKFVAAQSTSLENSTIANQGGNIGLRIMNSGLGQYNSNEEEINYDGRILKLENITNEDIKCKVRFDILIEVLDGMKYKTNVELELPTGNILENGVEIEEYNNIEDLIYKRY